MTTDEILELMSHEERAVVLGKQYAACMRYALRNSRLAPSQLRDACRAASDGARHGAAYGYRLWASEDAERYPERWQIRASVQMVTT